MLETSLGSKAGTISHTTHVTGCAALVMASASHGRRSVLTDSTRVWWQVLRGKTRMSPARMTSSVGLSFRASGYFCGCTWLSTLGLRIQGALQQEVALCDASQQ
jgi:hypothetical protein